MRAKQLMLTVLVGVVFDGTRQVHSHARLWEPPGRSTMWRRGFDTPVNYQDNELFCGGFQHEVDLGYKCGICGDPYDGPRENEAGGKYATGVIARTYRQAQALTLQVDVTANHAGYFEFKICPTNEPSVRATEDCLARYPVTIAGTTGTRYTLNKGQLGIVSVDVILPAQLTCDYCTLQWKYHAANNWGTEASGTSCVGCGPQEEFYGCADIRILSSHSGRDIRPPSPTVSSAPPSRATQKGKSGIVGASTRGWRKSGQRVSTGSPHKNHQLGSGTPVNGDDVTCYGINKRKQLDLWCQYNCQVGFCPEDFCQCEMSPFAHVTSRPKGCRAAGAYANLPGFDNWCQSNCASGNCPHSLCAC